MADFLDFTFICLVIFYDNDCFDDYNDFASDIMLVMIWINEIFLWQKIVKKFSF